MCFYVFLLETYLLGTNTSSSNLTYNHYNNYFCQYLIKNNYVRIQNFNKFSRLIMWLSEYWNRRIIKLLGVIYSLVLNDPIHVITKFGNIQKLIWLTAKTNMWHKLPMFQNKFGHVGLNILKLLAWLAKHKTYFQTNHKWYSE